MSFEQGYDTITGERGYRLSTIRGADVIFGLEDGRLDLPDAGGPGRLGPDRR